MPFVAEKESVLGVTGSVPRFDATAHGFFSETLPAAFRTENTVASVINRIKYDGPDAIIENPDYDPFENIEGTVFEDRPGALIFVDTPEERAAVERRIMQEIEDRQTVASSGAYGFAADFAAGLFDPMILIPVGGEIAIAGKSASVLARAASVGRAGFIGISASEAVLQATQEVRTTGESALNISVGTFLAGILGGSVAALDAPTRAAFMRGVRRNLNREKPSGAGIREVEISDKSVLSDTVLAGGSGTEPRLTAPVDVDTRPSVLKRRMSEIGEKLDFSFGFTKLTQKLTPGQRIAIESFSINARRILQEAFDTPWFYKKNASGVRTPVSVESRMMRWDAKLGQATEDRNRFFARYRARIAGRDEPTGFLGRGVERVRAVAADVRKGDIDRLTLKQFNERVGRAMRYGDRDPLIPEIQQAAERYRELVFDPIKDDAISLGLLPEDVSVETALSYLTRVWNPERVKAQSDKLVENTKLWLAERHPELSAKEVERVAISIKNKLLGQEDGRIAYESMTFGQASPLKKRTFAIEDQRIEEFLESDIDLVARMYVRSMASDIELTRTFGSVDMADELLSVKKEYDQFIQKNADELTDDERLLLEKRKERDLEDLRALRDRLRGVYGNPQDPNHVVSRVFQGIRRTNYITKGGGFMVSSIPDVASLVLANGLRKTMGSAFRMVAAGTRARRLAAHEIKSYGTAWDVVLNTRAEKIMDIGDSFGRHTKFERAMGSISDSFSLVNLLAPWNAAIKQFAGITTQNRILEVISVGNISKANLRKLARLGIDEDVAKRISDQYGLHGRSENGLRIASVDDWSDFEAGEIFASAIRKEVDEQIVTPGVLDTPLFMSKEWGKTIGQFKTFMFASTNRVALLRLQQGDVAALNGLLLATGLGAMVYTLKQLQAGREISDNPGIIIKEAIDRSGVTGFVMDANNIIEKATRNSFGLSAVLGGPTASRYSSRRVSDALFGPSVGLIDQVSALVGTFATGETHESDGKAVRRMIPYQNLFYLDKLFDAFEKATAEEFRSQRLGREIGRDQ